MRHLLFTHMVQRPEPEIDLAAAALLIAEEEYPGLDVAAYVRKLDRLGAGLRRRLSTWTPAEEPAPAIRALNGLLYEEQGFHGNQQDYYDPRNSFLNEVIDRRTGIPITLSIVYIEVARRIGFDLDGVGFPGHFLVKHTHAGLRSVIVIDPFFQGRTLDANDLREMLSAVHGRAVPLEMRHLNGLGKRQILARVLRNLQSIYSERGDTARALSAVERLLILDPEDAQALREREALEQADRRAN